MGRIVAIDFGTVRIGIALTDAGQRIAQPYKCLQAKKTLEATAAFIASELATFSPLDSIVLGLPLHMNMKESPLSLEVRRFAEILKQTMQVPVILWDERLSTALVEKCLKEGNVRRKDRTPLVDALVATYLLQNYLAKIQNV